MPVTLRNPNNPTTDTKVLAALAQIVPGYPTPNTQLAIASASQTGAELVYVQTEFAMWQTALFPAVLLSSGPQGYTRKSWRSYDGVLQAFVDYYDVWEQTTRTFDQIRADIAADLERIKANVESNDSLTIGGAAMTVSAPKMSLSPYEGNFFRNEAGREFIYRRLAINFLLLDFDV